MESQNIEFRAVIKFLTKEGAKAKEIHRCMADVYGDSSPKYSTVAKWSAEFKRGRLRRLILVCAVRICRKTHLRMAWPVCL